MYGDTMNVEHEMYEDTAYNWSHQNSNNRFTEKFDIHTRKTLDRFTTKDSYPRNITHNMELLQSEN
jgi:hypothetical protein